MSKFKHAEPEIAMTISCYLAYFLLVEWLYKSDMLTVRAKWLSNWDLFLSV
jgi:hypothetical protein